MKILGFGLILQFYSVYDHEAIHKQGNGNAINIKDLGLTAPATRSKTLHLD